MSHQLAKRTHRRTALVIAATLLTGCGGEEVAKLNDYLDELEFEVPLESVVPVEAGKYRVHVPAKTPGDEAGVANSVWLQLNFNLLVFVAPEDQGAVTSAIERRSGELNDTVIRVCRAASLDEIHEPRLSMLKFRLSDAIEHIVGDHRVRQIVFDEFQSEPI